MFKVTLAWLKETVELLEEVVAVTAQDEPVVGLQPVAEVHPAGRVVVVEQDWSVVGLKPTFEVQPAGYITVKEHD